MCWCMQRSRGEFSERFASNQGIVTGDDSELAATAYTHGAMESELDVQVRIIPYATLF
jgi:hypothetical protein